MVAIIVLSAILVFAVIRDALGDPEDALRAFPADTGIVVSADLAQLADRDSYDGLLDAITEVLRSEGELGAEEDPVEALITEIETDAGLDLRRDVVSWIGRSVAIGVNGDVTSDLPEFLVVSISVRSESKARSFFTDVLPSLEDPVSVDTTQVAGREAFIIDGDGDSPAYLAITDGLAVFGVSEAALTASLDALDAGTSVLDNPRFIAAADRMPDGVWVSVYVDGRFIEDIVEQAFAEFEETGQADVDNFLTDFRESLRTLESVGMWAGVTDEAVTVETWAIGDEVGVAGANDLVGIPQDVLDSLPRDTFLVVGGGRPDADGIAQAIEDFSAASPELADGIRQASIEALGFDVLDELLAGIGSEVFFAVLGDDASAAAAETHLSFLLSASLVDEGLVRSGIAQLDDFVADNIGQFRPTDGIGEVALRDCGSFAFIDCGGWVSAEFPVFEDQGVVERTIEDLVDRYGREIAVIALFDDDGGPPTTGSDVAEAWGMDRSDGIVVVIGLAEGSVSVYGGRTSGLTDPAAAEAAAIGRVMPGLLTAAVIDVLAEIETQLAAATTGEALGGRTPDDAFALRGQPLFAYGIQDGRLYVATSAAVIGRLNGSEASLRDNPALAGISEALGGEELILFGDLTTLQELGVLEPGTLPLDEGNRMAFGAALTRETGAIGFRMVFAIVD